MVNRRNLAEFLNLAWALEGVDPIPSVEDIEKNLDADRAQSKAEFEVWLKLIDEDGGSLSLSTKEEISRITFAAPEHFSNTRLTMVDVLSIRSRARDFADGIGIVDLIVEGAIANDIDPVEALRAFGHGTFIK